MRNFNAKIQNLYYFSFETQVSLLRNSWSDLFVLGLVQCSDKIDLAELLDKVTNSLIISVDQENVSAQKVKIISTTICKVQEYVKAMAKLNIDTKEFAMLKLCAIVNTGLLFSKKSSNKI